MDTINLTLKTLVSHIPNPNSKLISLCPRGSVLENVRIR